MPGQCEHCMRYVPWDDMEGRHCLRCSGEYNPMVMDDGTIQVGMGGWNTTIGQILEPVEEGEQES